MRIVSAVVHLATIAAILGTISLCEGCARACSSCRGVGHSAAGTRACDECAGKGFVEGELEKAPCPYCGGTKWRRKFGERVMCTFCDANGKAMVPKAEPCSKCKGQKFVCPTCGGSGKA